MIRENEIEKLNEISGPQLEVFLCDPVKLSQNFIHDFKS